MGIETGNYINDLDADWPLATDNVSDGDNHLRLVKKVLKASFPGVDRVSEYIYVHTSAPTVSVGKGRLWLDTSTTPNLLKIYDGSNFKKLPISATIDYKLMGNDTVGWVLPTADGAANYPLTTTGSNVLAFAQIDTAAIADDAVTTDEIADSSVTTAKLSLTRPMFGARDEGTSCGSGSETLIKFSTEDFDIESKYDNSASNFKFTPNAGYYLIYGQLGVASPLGLSQYGLGFQCILYKDGAKYYEGSSVLFPYNANSVITNYMSRLVYSDGTDYWQIYAYQNSGSTLTTEVGNTSGFFATRVDV
jgi:hypothetical protein